MISVRDVVYDYPASRALHGVGFEVRPGAVMALVGPNGAGKSTLMRCIAALDSPLSGKITVAGMDTGEDPRGVHAALGYLPDFFGLYEELSVRRGLYYAARSRGVPEPAADKAVELAAARVGLTDRLEQRAGALSRGLKQRLAIGQTIVHQPKVLLLDEPAAGLDPEARRDLSDLIARLAGEGMTILVSSHILAELEDYSTEMLMLREGRVAGGGPVSAGQGSGGGGHERMKAEFSQAYPDLRERLEALGFQVEAAEPATAILSVPKEEADGALGRLVGGGLKVKSFAGLRSSLEDAYLREVAQPESRGEP